MSKLREPPGAGRSVFDLSVSTSPPATSEGPGPLRTKQKQNAFLPLEGPGGPDRATLGGDAASRVTGWAFEKGSPDPGGRSSKSLGVRSAKFCDPCFAEAVF